MSDVESCKIPDSLSLESIDKLLICYAKYAHVVPIHKLFTKMLQDD